MNITELYKKCIRGTGLTLLFAGCAGPVDTAKAPLRLSPAYHDAFFTTDEAIHPSTSAWWQFLNSPVLVELIETALRDSLNLMAIRERIIQAEALTSQTRADRLPELGAEINAYTERMGSGDETTRSSAGIRGRWRLDVSGALRYAEASRQFGVDVRRWELRQARLALSGHVAIAYLDMIAHARLAELLSRQESNARSMLDVVSARFNQGVATRLDVLQQEGLLTEILTQRPVIEREANSARLRLDVLLGRIPGSMMTKVEMSYPELLPLPGIGQPLDLLTQRPDLMIRQRLLNAADADAARALAERWPQLSLEFDLLWRDGASSSGGLISLAAGLFQPLLDQGRRKAEINRTRSFRDQLLAEYSAAFLAAVAEVEESVFAEQRQRDLLQRLARRLSILEEAQAQAAERYERGFTDFLPVITASQNLLSLQQRLVREQRNQIAIRIGIYEAMGGPMP